MSDSSPASPAPSAESQPTDVQSDAVPEAPAVESRASKVRPIKGSPPKGPTVKYNSSFSAMEVTPELPEGRQDIDSPEPKEAGERPRDAFGRFTSGEQDETDGQPADLPEPEPEPEPVLFGGKKWKSYAEAEQNYKSLQGQFKPLSEKAAKASEHEAKAAGWYREAQRLSAELAALKGGQTAKPVEATPQESKGLDWGLYAEIRKAAEEAGKPHEAERWLLEQHEKLQATARKAEQDAFLKQVSDVLAPIAMRQQASQAVETIDQVRQSLGEHTDAQGNPLFPELQDANDAYLIGKTWRDAGMPPETIFTPHGLASATLLYRFLKAQSPAIETPETEIETETGDGEAEEVVPAAAMARTAMLTGGATARTRSSSTVPPEVARLVSAMRKTGRSSYYIDD